ncbi:unnamed protein product [Brassica oleracea var. botrytis]
MLRIKRSVSAGYSQVCSLISYNQVQLTSNCFWSILSIHLNYVLLFCLNSTMLVYCRVLCTLSITWHFTGITSLIIMCNLYFWYLNNRKRLIKERLKL